MQTLKPRAVQLTRSKKWLAWMPDALLNNNRDVPACVVSVTLDGALKHLHNEVIQSQVRKKNEDQRP